MWVLSRSDWPVLVNLANSAAVSYQQVSKFDPRVRVVATSWEAEHLLAECETGEAAQALVRYLGQAIRQGSGYVDLNRVSIEETLAARDRTDDGML